MKRFLSCAVLVLAALALAGCATDPLAVVNGEPITRAELLESFQSSHEGHLALISKEEEYRRYLNQAIDGLLLSQEAYRIGLNKDPDVVKAVDRFRLQTIKELLYKEAVKDKAKVSDQDLHKAYLLSKTRNYLFLIRVDSRNTGEEILRSLASGESFRSLAARYSRGPSSKQGGEMGWVTWGVLPPRVEKAAYRLNLGQTSPLIAQGDSFYILKLTGRSGEGDKAKNPPRKLVEPILERRREQTLRKRFLDGLWEKFRPVIAGNLLRKEILLNPPAGAEEKPVLKTGSHTISLRELRKELDLEKIKKAKPEEVERNLKEYLKARADDWLQEEEALRRGLDRRPEVVRAVRIFEERMIRNKLYAKVIVPSVKITDAEVKQYYKKHPKEFTVPERLQLSHILVSSKEEAEKLLAEIRAGKDFATLAYAKSEDKESALAGGSVGWIARGQVLKPIEDLAFSLKPGEVGGPVKTRLGYHLIKVGRRLPARLLPYEQVAGAAREKLYRLRRREKLQSWLKKLKENAHIVINRYAVSAAAADAAAEISKEEEHADTP